MARSDQGGNREWAQLCAGGGIGEGGDRGAEVLVTKLLMSWPVSWEMPQGDCEPFPAGYFPTGCQGSHIPHLGDPRKLQIKYETKKE